jgi:photosystem II stability/assembly factor-like uncharacterized protein
MPRFYGAARPLAAVLALVAALTLPQAHAQKQKQKQQTPAKDASATAPNPNAPDSIYLSALKWRTIGPEGNRTDAIAGVKGDPNIYYAGSASGGVFKTSDAGAHWEPIFDSQPAQSIGAIAVAESDPNVVWVGTGEAFIRSHISVGWGMFRSNDAGKTWTRAGLENTGRISRIAIDPTNPDRVFVAALGYSYGPQPDRGVFRTLDGGKTWEKVLFVNDSTGAVDVIMDPNNPRILYAGMWQIEIHTWGRESGGKGSGVYKSTDGGTTWKRLENGLPTKPFGKIGLGISAANSKRVYAQIEVGDGVPWHGVPTDTGRLWRSDDAGDTWKLVNSDLQPMGRTAYYSRMGVEPDNANELYFLAGDFTHSLDGGTTMIDLPREQIPRGDHHDIWFDPTNGNRFAVAHDGGVGITTTRGKTWMRIQLPNAQMYHVTVDNRVPYYVYGNKQDGSSFMGPSNSKENFFGFDAGIWRGKWRGVGGGESGWATPDTVDTNVVWSSASGTGSVGGIVTRYDIPTQIVRSVEVWPQFVAGAPAEEAKYRFVWTAPLTISPHDHNIVYTGSQVLHRTTNGGQSWEVMSPDLTKNDKSKQGLSGGLTPDNIGVEYADVIFAIAESPLAKGEIWIGTNDGLVQLTRDNGKTWTNLTANIPKGFPAWGTISNIEVSRFAAGTAYLTVDGHQVNDRDPWVYKTTDYGKTWALIVKGIPKTPLSYAHCVREDPTRKGLLYLGTEGGMYVSVDDGANWQSLQNNLPHAPVYWIAVQPHFHDLVIATYGRGFWILDDLTPLMQWDKGVTAKPVALIKPRDQYRYRAVAEPFSEMDDVTAGKNPPDGAILDFWLQSALKDTLKDSVTISVANASGTVVRTFKTKGKAGLNRAVWDLQGEKTKEAKIRAAPLYSNWFEVKASGVKAPSLQRYSLLQAPGTYKVTVTANGASDSQPLVLLKDPASGGSEQTIAEQMQTNQAIVGDINDAVDQINSLEMVRGQLAGLTDLAGKDSTLAELKNTTEALRDKLVNVEQQLFQMKITGRGQDDVRWSPRITEQLLYLAFNVGDSDYQPTDQAKAVAKVLHDQLAEVKTKIDQLLKQDVPAFNEKLRGKNIHPVVSEGAAGSQ